MKCAYCDGRAYGPDGLCSSCQDKLRALRSHGRVFAKDPSEARKNIGIRQRQRDIAEFFCASDKYIAEYDEKHGMKIGAGTKRLVDFVNATGSVHYGRVVAEHERGKK